MFDIHSVPLTTLVQEFKLEVAYAATDYEKIRHRSNNYANAENASPHTWHAAEMFLYLIEKN